jgi:hypothetical protein
MAQAAMREHDYAAARALGDKAVRLAAVLKQSAPQHRKSSR